MQFPNIHQSFDPRTDTFVPTFNPQFQFQQNQNRQQTQSNEQSQSNQNVGGSSSASIPLFSTQQPSLEPIQAEGSQPAKKKNATKKNKVTESQDVEEPINWTKEEEIALTDAWCCTSQDEVKGTDQSGAGLWAAIHKKFHNRMGKGPNYRSRDSLTSKWSLMKTKLTSFNGIFHRIENNHQTGGMRRKC